MKTQLLKKITMILMVSVLVIGAGSSCKKDDPTTPTPPIDDSGIPVVIPEYTFNTGQLDMMCDLEKENDFKLHAQLLGNYMDGSAVLSSEVPNGAISASLDIIGAITGYNEGKKALKDLKKDIAGVKADIANVEASIAQLANEIAQLMDEIKDELAIVENTLELDGEFATIDQLGSQMDVIYASQAGNISFNFFATKIHDLINSADTAHPDILRAALEEIKSDFNVHFANDDHISKAQEYINGIQAALGTANNSVLSKSIKLYILNHPNPTPESALRFYSYMEKRILKALHHQLKGLIVTANIQNSLGHTADLNQWYTDFSNNIQSELQLLRDVTYSLAINSTNINADKYNSDMRFVNVGLAPDTEFNNLLARMEFTCSIIEADGVAMDNCFAGVVYTPYYYYQGGQATPVTNTINGTINGLSYKMTQNNQAQIVNSLIPYTRWQNSNNVMTSSADNQWVFYNCEVPLSQGSITQEAKNIIIFPNTASNNPWHHNLGSSVNYETNVTIFWYDPTDPDFSTCTPNQTSTNTTPFGFFAMRWLWGYQAMSQSEFNKTIKLTDPSSPNHYNFYYTTPFVNPTYYNWFLNEKYKNDFVNIPNASNPNVFNSIGFDFIQQQTTDTPITWYLNTTKLGYSIQYEQSFLFNRSSQLGNDSIILFNTSHLIRKGSFHTVEFNDITQADRAGIHYINNTGDYQIADIELYSTNANLNDSVFVQFPLLTGNFDIPITLQTYLYHTDASATWRENERLGLPLNYRYNYTMQLIYTGKFPKPQP
ncbi:MAG: hypothetical protein KKF98_09835 [Bacteroidetes bacterium]|nr:hypothetical protein [Bacteroidota bacterium]